MGQEHGEREASTPSRSLAAATADFQRRLISEAVAASGGNWAQAARLLDVDRSNLHRLAKRLGLR